MNRLKPRPVPSVNDEKNRTFAHAELSSEPLLTNSARCIAAANLKHFGLRQLGLKVFLSNVVLPPSAFVQAILRVFFACAKKQMARIYAKWIISSGAIVADYQSIGYWPVGDLPRNPMRSFYVRSHSDCSIPAHRTRSPQPARIRLVDFGPKSFSKGWSLSAKLTARPTAITTIAFFCITGIRDKGATAVFTTSMGATLIVHHDLQSWCLALGCYSTAGAFSMCANYTLSTAQVVG